MKRILWVLLPLFALLPFAGCAQSSADKTPSAQQLVGVWRSSGVDVLGWEFEANGKYRAGTEEGTYTVSGNTLTLNRESTAKVVAKKTETYEIISFQPGVLVVRQGDKVRTFEKDKPKDN